jgi:peptidoglycan/xylan/chitin deacetylase (PgdA/CDA1 family)
MVSSVRGRLRWGLKKAGRQGLALAAWGSGRLAPSETPCVRVLTYHRVGPATRDPFSVDPDDFSRQMAWLANNGLAVSLLELEDFLAGRRPLRTSPAVLVTVDDGLVSLRSHALPALVRYGIPAVAFVPAGEISDDIDGTGRYAERHLTWAELRAVSAAGITIGSHAWAHRSLARLPAALVREEVCRARNSLERRTGEPVTAFAYPFGTRADFSTEVARILAECGHTCAFTSQHGAVRPGLDPFTLPRVKIEGGEPAWMFPLLCRGALDAWRWIDRTLWRLQESGA